MTIERDGTLDVHETIVYDFGDTEHHGIDRELVRRETFDAKHDRLYELHVTECVRERGTLPTTRQISDNGSFLQVRIGDPNRTITGVHTYDISYTVKGALLPFPDHDELNWDVIGHEWSVPIDAAARRPCTRRRPSTASRASADRRAAAPAATRRRANGRDATFAQANLAAGRGDDRGCRAPERRDRARAEADPRAAPHVGRRVRGDAGHRRHRRRTRDRWASRASPCSRIAAAATASGRAPQSTPRWGTCPARKRRSRWAGASPDRWSSYRPDNVRPGQVGTLIDEQANLLDVTATIVDLAVRGHLRITEIEGAHNDDYELVRTEGGKGALLPYEQELYDALFATGPDVKLSDLKYKFTSELAGVKNALYDDVVTNGWYRVRPDRTRMWWRLIGFGVTLLGVAADGHHRRGLVVRTDPARGARHRHRAARASAASCRPERARARRCSRASRVSAGSSTKARRTPANASPSSRGSSRTTCRTRSSSAPRRSGRARSKG